MDCSRADVLPVVGFSRGRDELEAQAEERSQVFEWGVRTCKVVKGKM